MLKLPDLGKYFLFFCMIVFAVQAFSNEETNGQAVQEKPEKKEENLRDPTRPLGHIARKASEARLELQAIYVRESGSKAIINGQSVGVGESVNGATLVAIKEKSVVYRRGAQTRLLVLRENVLANTAK